MKLAATELSFVINNDLPTCKIFCWVHLYFGDLTHEASFRSDVVGAKGWNVPPQVLSAICV